MPSLSRLTRSYERAFKHHPSLTLAITNGCLKCLGDFLAQYLPAFSSGQPFVLDIHRSLRFFLFGFLHGPCVGKWHEFLERRIPLTGGRATSNNGVTDPGATPEMEQEDLRLIETEKSLTSHRPISIRSRSTTGPEHHPGALRGLSNSDAPLSSFPHNSNQHLTGLSKLGNPTRAAATGFRVFGLLKRILLDQLLMAPIYTFLFISLTGWFEGLSIPEIQQRLHQLYWYLLTANWKIWPLIQIFNFSFMPLQYRVPWQGSCGVLWTVFLSLSTHSSTHYSSSTTTVDPTGPTLVASTLSKLFKSGNSSASDPHIISSNHLANSSSASSSSPSSNDPSSPIKRKNNRVIG
ncbi:hypothetical protein PGT21_013990 [Puccinia graminis f. sp. tritici]|nr:hypothetical protein PGT21_013990 [Puccinia graminis f. sp. tritici]